MLSQTLLAARERDEVLTLILQHCEEEAQFAQDDASPTRSNLRDVRNFPIPSWNRVLLFASGPNVRFLLLATTDKRPRLLRGSFRCSHCRFIFCISCPNRRTSRSACDDCSALWKSWDSSRTSLPAGREAGDDGCAGAAGSAPTTTTALVVSDAACAARTDRVRLRDRCLRR